MTQPASLGAAPGTSRLAPIITRAASTGQAEIVEFLSRPGSYAHGPASVEIIETHLALVFLAGPRVFKIKRALNLKHLDMRQLARRRNLCLREVELNRRLAPDVYLGNSTITREADGTLAIDGKGEAVEAMVVMRRLDVSQGLDQHIVQGTITPDQIDELCAVLADFYLGQPPAAISPHDYIAWWHKMLDRLRFTLTDPQFALEQELVSPSLEYLTAFLHDSADMLGALVEQGRIVDGHGDLKPEHVILGTPLLVIDRIEFDDRLRVNDPFTEVTFLGLECDRLGAAWIAPRLIDCLAQRIGSHRPPELLRFYRCYLACLRARLSIEHMLDETPRTPERWPRQAREYLKLALEGLQL